MGTKRICDVCQCELSHTTGHGDEFAATIHGEEFLEPPSTSSFTVELCRDCATDIYREVERIAHGHFGDGEG